MIRFGIHASLKNGLNSAVEQALEAGCEAMQIFTKSPRAWHIKKYSDKEILSFRQEFKKSGLYPLVVHTFYLQNLATSKEELYKKSLVTLEKDMTLASQIGAKYYVVHPGYYSEDSTLDKGIGQIACSINEIYKNKNITASIALENLSGEGRKIGSYFDELARIIDKVKDKSKVCVCFDTAHAFGAGYDLSDPKKTDAILKDFDKTIGLKYLKVIHFNDSKMPLDSKRDRHEHLGKGFIGSKGMKSFVQAVKDIAEAGIIETPKIAETAMKNDRANLKKLFSWRNSK